MVKIHIYVSEFDLFGKVICMYAAVCMDAHGTTMYRFLDFHLHSFCNNTLMIVLLQFYLNLGQLFYIWNFEKQCYHCHYGPFDSILLCLKPHAVLIACACDHRFGWMFYGVLCVASGSTAQFSSEWLFNWLKTLGWSAYHPSGLGGFMLVSVTGQPGTHAGTRLIYTFQPVIFVLFCKLCRYV